MQRKYSYYINNFYTSLKTVTWFAVYKFAVSSSVCEIVTGKRIRIAIKLNTRRKIVDVKVINGKVSTLVLKWKSSYSLARMDVFLLELT